MKKLFSSLMSIVLVGAIAFTGCASDKGSSTENENNTEANGAYPIVIEHALGTTTIEEKPVRIAAVGSRNEDVALALGVVPVGISYNWYGVLDDSGLYEWSNEAIAKLGGETVVYDDLDGLDFEAISASEPDVILATYSGITAEDYELLTQIAPTVAYTTMAWQVDWRNQTLVNAKAMGMEEEGKQMVADLEALISEEAAKYPEIEGKTAAFFSFDVTDLSKFWLYLPTDSRAAHMEDFGFVVPESVKKFAEQEESFAIQVSAENVELLSDIDVMVMYGDEETLKTLANDSLIGTIPAIQRGSVALIADNTPLAAAANPSALSIPACSAELASIYGAAAAKVK